MSRPPARAMETSGPGRSLSVKLCFVDVSAGDEILGEPQLNSDLYTDGGSRN